MLSFRDRSPHICGNLFRREPRTCWQLVANDGTGAPTLTDMVAIFGIAMGGVLTLFIGAAPNGSSVWVRVVDEVSGAVFEQETTADLPASMLRQSIERGCPRRTRMKGRPGPRTGPPSPPPAPAAEPTG